MTEAQIISDINLLEAHATAALIIAARLREKIQPSVSTDKASKSGLSATVKAKLLARKNRNIKCTSK